MFSHTNYLTFIKPGGIANNIFVRWRKPIYAPIAPSKLFRVVERNKQSSEEFQWLKKQYANYRSRMRSLRSYLASNLEKSHTDLHKEDADLVAGHYKFIEEANKSFNEKSALNRIRREALELKEKENRIKSEIESIELEKLIRKENALQLVLQAKKDVESFITRENIDAAIDSALNERSTFRFAVDLEGNILKEQVDGSVTIIESKVRTNNAKFRESNSNDIGFENLELTEKKDENMDVKTS